MSSEHVRIEGVPRLRQPILVAAFQGWNDASQAATFALTTLLATWKAEPFADIDPESFFVFTETRPTISIGSNGQRDLQWPGNTFYAHKAPEAKRDVVLLIGTEPQLRWRTFCSQIIRVADQVRASRLITIGGLLADVPHTIDPRLTGFAWPSRLSPKLRAQGVETSGYEGPTGVVGVLHDGWSATGRPAMSLWGSVPHYISATPNPQVSLAILRRLEALLNIPIPLSILESQATAFQARINEALMDNPEALEYVKQLEAQAAGEGPGPSPELIQELEQFLRTRRGPADGREE